jgi:hypothetical protein
MQAGDLAAALSAADMTYALKWQPGNEKIRASPGTGGALRPQTRICDFSPSANIPPSKSFSAGRKSLSAALSRPIFPGLRKYIKSAGDDGALFSKLLVSYRPFDLLSARVELASVCRNNRLCAAQLYQLANKLAVTAN